MPQTVELLFWAGCPSHPLALELLTDVMSELDLDPGIIRQQEILTEADARRRRFKGSPTILIDGIDVDDSGADAVMLACRLYRRRDGGSSPVPDREDLREALSAAPGPRGRG